ncbi:protein kinase [Acetobacter sp. TBRC 12305]|uniref:non-specific serine/threonine protein kinase n=1 Tax=Acetobacter garciniae TaxID=2817435 RepID=A0A939HPS8_9PROT|nr:serine/threonine-protein kinase [Acetobacter garciniae]MBO1326511.1 protein kinase [Acetobacter garciniae]MBX0346173.1 protein kinase [Acetobacter garciniae]
MSDMLGKYELRRVLGKGAMGTVYEGYDPVIDRTVAIKTVRLVGADSEDAQALEELERFRREAKAAGRLQHPNIVGVFDYGETDDIAYIVMEYVDGTTLKQVLDNGERYGVDEVVRLMDALLAGLQFSHDRGVVHRDIKPANVMLTAAGAIKIADFGIARIESSSFTQAGTILGTPAYMSPEQFMGQRVDARTDIYSTGVMLYQILTGDKPFDGGLTAIMHKVLNSEPLPPSALSVAVTPALDHVVLTAMAKQPEKRYASASAFAAALRNALHAEPSTGADQDRSGRGKSGPDDDDGTLVVQSARVPTSPLPATAPGPGAWRAATPRKNLPLAGIAVGGLLVVAALGGGGYFLFGSGHGDQPAMTSAAQAGPAEGAPAPAMPPAPQQAQAPGAQASAAPDPLRIAAAVGTLPCSFLTTGRDGEQVSLSGYIGAGAPRVALDTAMAKLPGSAAQIRNTVRTVDGPYCPIFDALRPYHGVTSGGSGLAMVLSGGDRPLHDGDPISIAVKLPAFPAHLWTVYFSNDGSAVRIYPTSSDGAHAFAANATKTLGDGTQGGARMQVGAPFGTDLAVSLASSTPFPAGRIPAEGNVASMTAAMTELLSKAVGSGGQVAMELHPVLTRPKGQ